jgi:hypothetical protein
VKDWKYVNQQEFGEANEEKLVGLKDVEGTFEGVLDTATFDSQLFAQSGAQEIFIYAPKDLPWWRHWIARLRERLFDVPYPVEVIYAGKLDTVDMTTDDEGTTFTATFSKDGTFRID